MINKVILIGNLGADPEIKELSNGAKVGRFSLATNENYKDNNGEWQSKTEWHNVVVWRNLAEQSERILKKGSKVYIEGKIKYRKWQDENGNDRYATDIEARLFRSLDKRENDGMGNTNNFPGVQDAPSYAKTEQPAATTSKESTNQNSQVSDAMMDDDLPF